MLAGYRVMLLKGIKTGDLPVLWKFLQARPETQAQAEAEADRLAGLLRKNRLPGIALVVDERDRVLYQGTPQAGGF